MQSIGMFDPDNIVRKKNQYQIGQWSLLYNGELNKVSFAFSQIKPKLLKISIVDSTGWVRLIRPLECKREVGIYVVEMSVRSLTQSPESTYKAYVFLEHEKGRFAKHSELVLKDGRYKSRLHLEGGASKFWIGFETTDENIDLHINYMKIEVKPVVQEMIELASECKKVIRPLVEAESKSEKYLKVKNLNQDFNEGAKRNELPFILEYASALRQVEMPDTFVRMIKYLTTRYKEMPVGQKGILETQIRNALLLAHDPELIDIIYARCPEVIFRMKLNSDMFERIIGLDCVESNEDIQSVLQSYSPLYACQDKPVQLSNVIKGLMLENPDYLEMKPQTFAIMANLFASRQNCEAKYIGLLNKYFGKYSLVRASSTSFDSKVCLSDIEFEKTPNIDHGPLVSVVMSAFDAEDTIEYAVRSILNQSYKNLELLVCDDGSSDDTVKLLSKLSQSDSRIKIYKSIANQGTYNIRNDMIARCKGEFITFQDSDDFSLPTRVQEQIKNLLEKDALVSFTNWIRIRQNGAVVVFHDGLISRFCVVSAMAHRSVFERLPKFRSSYVAADTEFYENAKNLLGAESISIDSRPLILGLWSESSLTRQENLTAEHNGYVAPRRRKYAEVASRQRLLGSQVVTDTMVDNTLKALDIYRTPCGSEAI